jgi:O-antigen/teichoic acid export membrane protein
VVPEAYRGDFARLTFALAPGLFAFSAVHSMFSHIFQLAKRTWPLTLAALAALGADVILLRWGGAEASVDGLAWAYTASLTVGLVVAMVQAMREAKVWPPFRDCAVIAIATLAMTMAIRPLNGVGSPAVAGALALVVGGTIYGGAMWTFDVGGFREIAASILRGLRFGRSRAREAEVGDSLRKRPGRRGSSIDSEAA